ncbi:MAG: hypothetical protein ACOC80_17020 [Petrotogales bacterium]
MLEEKMKHLNVTTFPEEYKEFVEMAISIIGEYKGLVSEKLKEVDKESAMKKIEQDIQNTQSQLYDDKGRLRLPSDQIKTYVEKFGKESKEVSSTFIAGFMAPLAHFINYYIYNSFIQGIENQHEHLHNNFVIAVANKAGVLRAPDLKGNDFMETVEPESSEEDNNA